MMRVMRGQWGQVSRAWVRVWVYGPVISVRAMLVLVRRLRGRQVMLVRMLMWVGQLRWSLRMDWVWLMVSRMDRRVRLRKVVVMVVMIRLLQWEGLLGMLGGVSSVRGPWAVVLLLMVPMVITGTTALGLMTSTGTTAAAAISGTWV